MVGFWSIFGEEGVGFWVVSPRRERVGFVGKRWSILSIDERKSAREKPVKGTRWVVRIGREG